MASRCTVRAPVRAAPDILLVEDEILLRESLQEALEEAGHRVAVARHGGEALAMLDRLTRPAVVVLDLQMPVMDGLGFLDQFRRRPDQGDFGVVAMSAIIDGEWVENAPGVFRTLRKPFDVEELLESVDDFFARTAPSASASTVAEQATPVLGPGAAAAGPTED